MHTLRLLQYCIYFFYAQEICGTPFTLKILHRPSRRNINDFKSNVNLYFKILNYFFEHRTSDKPVAKIDKNVDYYGMIHMGSSRNNQFSVNIDTSFSGLWVPSCSCTSSSPCYLKTYCLTNSLDFIEDIEPRKRTINYIIDCDTLLNKSSIVQGDAGFDSLWVNQQKVPVTHFLGATDVSYDLFLGLSDGVFGLGFLSSSLKMVPPFFTMLDRGLVDRPEFSLYIDKHSQTGELLFGARNPELFNNNTLHFHRLNSTDFWEIVLDSIAIINDGIELCPWRCQALVDTGSLLLAAPNNALRKIYKYLNLPYTGEIAELNCEELSALPVLNITINEQVFTFTGFDYTLQIGMDNKCILGIMESPKPGYWILGNLFLSKVYTVFNVAEMKIGFAELRDQAPLKPFHS